MIFKKSISSAISYSGGGVVKAFVENSAKNVSFILRALLEVS